MTVLTYKRSDGLEAFLASVLPQLSGRAALLVVDNDPLGSARSLVEGMALEGGPVHYVVEERPGIAAARNRALDYFAGSDYDAIIFVDDDEYAAPDWLEELCGYASTSSAGVVSGPVVPVFPEQTPEWIKRAGFHLRPDVATGSESWTAASNNTLLKRRAWEDAGRPRFDNAFSKTGGSDTDFFSRVRATGISIEHCAEARVFEPVAPNRLNKRWLARRAYRSGIVNGILFARSKHRAVVIGKGLATSALGFAGIFRGLVFHGRYAAKDWNRIIYGAGLISAQFGHRVHEYDRGL
ncbi:glycosyltransferase family 2 protein (plasmid) [Coraliomargarita sp. W4R53]